MLTVDTITDDQIRDLAARLGPNLADLVSRALSDLARQCKTCGVDIGTRCTNMSVTGYRPLKKSHPYRLEKQHEARARCAEILNAVMGRPDEESAESRVARGLHAAPGPHCVECGNKLTEAEADAQLPDHDEVCPACGGPSVQENA